METITLNFGPSRPIRTHDDVREFFRQLMKDVGTFHPDDDFNEYVQGCEQKPCFSSTESWRINQLMERAHEVCRGENVDIYALGLEVMNESK